MALAPSALLSNAGAEVVFDETRPDLGRFLRATRSFKTGELILHETPLFRVRGESFGDVEKLDSLIREAKLFLPAADSPVAQRLQEEARCRDGDATLIVRLALYFNSFAAGPSGMDQVVFQMLSRPNHSCAPNCYVDGDEGTLRAVRDVAAGEDLTISYLDEATLLWPKARRISELRNGWDFVCGCTRCASPLDDVRRFHSCALPGCKGDLLVHEIGTAPAHLVCTACSRRANEEVERTLLEQERVAAALMSELLSEDFEEEWEEGNAKGRIHKFSKNHPTHSLSLELAHQFQYPDAVESLRDLLKGFQVTFGQMPCQLTIDTNRELARCLRERGDTQGWKSSLEAAALISCELDGKSSAGEILNGWTDAPKPQENKPVSSQDIGFDLENCGGIAHDPIHSSKSISVSRPKQVAPTSLKKDDESTNHGRQELPIVSASSTFLQSSWRNPAGIVVLALLAGVCFSVFRSRRHARNS